MASERLPERVIAARNPKQAGKPLTSAHCGAKTRLGGECKGKAMPNGRCRMHGGKSPGAPLKTGFYSKYLPKDLGKAYESHLADSRLFDLRQDVAVITAMATTELEGASEGAPSLELWQQADSEYDQMMNGGPTGVAAANSLGRPLKLGVGKAEKIARAGKIIEQRTKTIHMRQKLEMEREHTQTVAQAMAYTTSLASGVNQAIEAAEIDQKWKEFIRRAVALHIDRSLRRSLGPGADAGAVA